MGHGIKPCKHPKTWRVSVTEHGMMLVEWCARCGSFKHHIEELVGQTRVGSASFENWVLPDLNKHKD
jgi:hypothetical protein